MARANYDLRKNLDGSWSVYDADEGRPAVVNGLPQVGLRRKVAMAVADRLSIDALVASARTAVAILADPQAAFPARTEAS